MTEQQYVEVFHLLFVKQLGDKVDKTFFAIKGGCNLRFFLKSIRYSEDIDFDVQTIAKDTLKLNVRKILSASSFKSILDSRGMTIVETSEPKQTETTQRWKVTLRVNGIEIPIHTKIEFSRRGLDEGVTFEAVDTQLVREYGLYPIYSTHYDKSSALKQKVQALIYRTEAQARDVFDLKLLLDAGAVPAAYAATDNDALKKGQENALSMSFQDFTSQVLAYLSPELRSNYDESIWNKNVGDVVDVLEGLKT